MIDEETREYLKELFKLLEDDTIIKDEFLNWIVDEK